MKRFIRLLSLLCALLCLLSVCACGDVSDTDTQNSSQTDSETGTGNETAVNEEDYQKAIEDLRTLLEKTCSDEELANPELLLNLFLPTKDTLYPIAVKQEELADLYQRFTSFGDYKQAKEIASRFSVIEQGSFTVNLIKADNGGERAIKIDSGILDAEGRRIWQGRDAENRGGILYVFNEDGTLLRKENKLNEYDDRGRCTKTTLLDKDLKINEVTVYTYDEGGNCTKAVTTSRTAVTITLTYTYDENGVLTNSVDRYERVHDRVYSTRENTYAYAFDEQGNRIAQKMHSKALGGIYSVTQDYVDVYSQKGHPIYSFVDTCIAEECPEAFITEFRYENGLPARITFASGKTVAFEYTTAYLFNEKGLTLS